MTTENRVWMHIGAGSFHRAHQAWYLHRLLMADPNSWTIALANIRDDSVPMMEKLAAQGCQYTLEIVDPDGKREYELITSIRKVVPWDKDLKAVVAEGADPATGVIAFTVTEAGYYLNTEFKLDQDNADLQADLKGGKNTIYGAIRAILAERKAKNGGRVTLLSCDNVRHNGIRFRDGLYEFLELRGDKELLGWIKENTTCPCCMVDRITPRPTPDIAKRVLAKTGFVDKVPVMSEAFIQWVVEENFAAGRPALEKVGVEMVKDVQPYEEAKIRILNVTHSCFAWAGTLVGRSFIHEDVQTPDIYKMAYDYITDDVIPNLSPSVVDLPAYRDMTLYRFGNPNIQDTNQRVAADGFSKIPAQVVPNLKDSYKRGSEPVATAMLPALFFVYLQRWHENKIPYKYQDGIMNKDAVHAMFNETDPLAVYCSDKALFGELAGEAKFTKLLRDSVDKVISWAANFKS